VTPRYSWEIDPTKVKITGPEVMQALANPADRHRQYGRWLQRHARPRSRRSGSWRRRTLGATPADRSRANDTPPSEHRGGGNGRPPADPNSFDFAVWQIKDGEDKLIGQTPKV